MSQVKQLCYISVLAALFVALDLLSIPIGNNMKITFGGLPIIVAAIYLGPAAGLVVGLVGSFIGQMIAFGLSATTALWILPAGMRGLSMGLLFIWFGRSYDWKRLGISILISSLLVTALNTLAIYVDSKVYGYYSVAVVFGMTAFRILSGVLTSVAYAAVIAPIVRALNLRKKA